MFKTVFAAALALSLATVAYAAQTTFNACTQDGKAVTLLVDINDTIAKTHPVADHINTAFTYAANNLSAEALLDEPGFSTFAAHLDETDFEAIDGLEAPVVIGTCK